MNNPSSNMSSIAAVVAKDQSLAARTIRLVNSAYYARRNRIPSIQHAIVVLGLTTLHNLMLGLSVVKLFQDSKLFGFDLEQFWVHSFAVALLSKKIARLVEKQLPCDPEECFIGGLLHDMGRLALQQFFHTDYERALKQCFTEKAALIGEEERVFGFTHADAGRWLGQQWGLQAKLTAIIACHHQPLQLADSYSGFLREIHIVSLANELSISESIGCSGETVIVEHVYPGLPSRHDSAIRTALKETQQEVISLVEEWTKEG
jgi:putative nucleotidyltransferase with HDIG domain